MVLLTVLSVVGAAALFVALALFLFPLVKCLEDVGGPSTRFNHQPANYLGKIRLGVRAIESETGGLGPRVTELNAGLEAIAGGLEAVDQNLAALLEAVVRQEEG